MNWYKTIKIAIPVIEKDTFEESGNPNFPNYADIGHETFLTGKPSRGCKEFMWIFIDGNLEVSITSEMGTASSLHNKVWKDKKIVLYYRGRVMKCGNKAAISLVPPVGTAMFKDVPNMVISRLYEKFGSNSKIYVIRPGV